MMTRSKARQILMAETLSAPSFFEFVLARKMGAKAIEQTTWIPVSERLPKAGENVLVSIDTLDGAKIAISSFGKYGCLCGEATAWMPLPAPYKREGDGE